MVTEGVFWLEMKTVEKECGHQMTQVDYKIMNNNFASKVQMLYSSYDIVIYTMYFWFARNIRNEGELYKSQSFINHKITPQNKNGTWKKLNLFNCVPSEIKNMANQAKVVSIYDDKRILIGPYSRTRW